MVFIEVPSVGEYLTITELQSVHSSGNSTSNVRPLLVLLVIVISVGAPGDGIVVVGTVVSIVSVVAGVVIGLVIVVGNGVFDS